MPRCLAELGELSECPHGIGPEMAIGLITPDEVPDAACLLVECFYYNDTAAVPGEAPEGRRRPAQRPLPPRPPTLPPPPPLAIGFFPQPHSLAPSSPEPISMELPPSLQDAPAMLQERWRTAQRGLHWRLAERLQHPSVALSMEASLLLALQDRRTGRLVACAEISLRPVDGKLPGEFAVPPLFLSHTESKMGAYLSNLAVAPDFRRRGVAKKLLSVCEWLVRREWSMPALFLHVDM